MTDSYHPLPPSSGNLKYAIVGVVLLLGTAGVVIGMQSCEEEQPTPVAQAAIDAGTALERSRAIAEDDLVIPDAVPDAGPQVDAGRRIRYVTRYVGGGGGGGDLACDSPGDIPRERANAVMAESRLQFRNCYERRLKVNNALEGSINVQMRVDRTGAVDAVRVGGTLRDSEVLSCVRGIARRIRFPAPSGGNCAVLSAPLDLHPNQ